MRSNRFGAAGLAAILCVGFGISNSAALSGQEWGSNPGEQTVLVRERAPMVSEERLKEHVEALCAFGTRHTFSERDSDTRGIGAAVRYVEAQFKSFGCEVEVEAFDAPVGARVPENSPPILNVVAKIPGKDPEQAHKHVYVVAHLDSRASDVMDSTSDAPGANDDASGVALLLELARVLSDEPMDSTVVFLATTGEEQGLLGARLHAQKVRDEGRVISGVFNNDMVGDSLAGSQSQPGESRRMTQVIRVFSEGIPRGTSRQLAEKIWSAAIENDGPSRALARYLGDRAGAEGSIVKPFHVYRSDRIGRGGDHIAFTEMGYAAIRLTDMFEKYERQHQDVRVEDGIEYGDTPKWIDYRYLANVTRLNLIGVGSLANAPSPPQNVRIVLGDEPSHLTLIRWDHPADTEPRRYEVMIRTTTMTEWQQVRAVQPGQTEFVSRAPKDSALFGVRSFDERGNPSVVAVVERITRE